MGDIAFNVAKDVALNKVVNLDLDKNVDVEVNNDDILATAEADAEAFGENALAETDAYTYVTPTEAFAYAESITAVDSFAIPPDDFDIELDFIDDSLTPAQQEIIEGAARRWEQIIIGDLPEVGSIDDIVIEVRAFDLDDSQFAGDLWGQAGTIERRNGSLLPYRSYVHIDSTNLDGTDPTLLSGQLLAELSQHEIGHALGFGTNWNDLDLLAGTNQNPRFVGTGATAEYNAIFPPELDVPVFGEGTSLSAGSHWRESTFDNELMTPFFNGVGNPLSRITVASMGDIGYVVDVNSADPYTPPSPLQDEALEIEPIGFDLVISSDDFATLGGRVFNDSNQNGVLDEDLDILLPGVAVNLLSDSLGTPVDTTVTDADGSYEFQSLAPDNYIVSFEFDFGNTPVEFVDPFQGNNPLLGSEVVSTTSEFPLSGTTDTISLFAEDIFGVNAGVVAFVP